MSTLLIVAVIAFLVCYPGWLRREKGISLLIPAHLLLGFVGAFLWIGFFDAEMLFGKLLAAALALVPALLLYVGCQRKGADETQALWMTLWYLLGGLVLWVLWFEAAHGKGRAKRKDD